MDELDEKLNSLLSDPDSMAQIMRLAQQLSGGLGSQEQSPSKPQSPPPKQTRESSSGSFSGGLDPTLAARLLPLLQEYGQTNTPAMELLHALGPYLKAEKREKIQWAAKLAHLIHIGKKFFLDWEG